jgi:hypothetical protein
MKREIVIATPAEIEGNSLRASLYFSLGIRRCAEGELIARLNAIRARFRLKGS